MDVDDVVGWFGCVVCGNVGCVLMFMYILCVDILWLVGVCLMVYCKDVDYEF